jgi:hypothetical protein
LDGFYVKFAPATGDKETRCKPVSAQAEAGNVKIIRGTWNEDFLRALENFPVARHDDDVDALSGAHGILSDNAGGGFTSANGIRTGQSTFIGDDSFLEPWEFITGLEVP